MADSKHTPGPWVFYVDGPTVDPEWNIVTTENRLRVLANVHIEQGNATDVANARLIAAAPELLAALGAALPVIEFSISYYGSSEAIDALALVRQAIAKATTP